MPLVLAFHGHGGTAALFERYTRLWALADQHGFLIAYPQGVLGPDGQTGWDTFRRRDPDTDDVGFVNMLLTRLQDTFCVDPARIYATGFSNGGGFVSVLACDLSSRIAAFAPGLGRLLSAAQRLPSIASRVDVGDSRYRRLHQPVQWERPVGLYERGTVAFGLGESR